MKFLLFLLSLLICIGCVYGIDEKFEKFFSDKVNFQFSYLSADDFEEHYSEDLKNLASLHTTNNEAYKCIIPEIELNQQKRAIDEYTGPQPFELLQPLFNGQCFIRAEPYWTLEFCLGKHVRQFHSDKQQSTIEYFLGYAPKVDPIEFDHSNLPTIEYGDNQVPYYSILYENGTTCDLNSKPRSTNVLFVCDDESTSNAFISMTETQSCQYELVFATNLLCYHPTFRKPRNNPYEIKCFLESAENIEDRIYARPESYKQFANDEKYSDFTEVLEKKAGIQHLTKQPTSIFDSIFQSVVKKATKAKEKEPTKKKYQLKKFERLTLEFEKKIAEKQLSQVLDAFFDMDYCFVVGGSKQGFKIEFCYRSKITIFEENEETGERENVIILGFWNEHLQRVIAKELPELVKSYSEEGSVERVVNYYFEGDVNSETKKENHVEVRMFCNMESDLLTAIDIKVFFVEHKTGTYRLYFESAVFCSYMEKMDKYGIYRNELDSMIVDAIRTLSPEKQAMFDIEEELEINNEKDEIVEAEELYEDENDEFIERTEEERDGDEEDDLSEEEEDLSDGERIEL